MDIGFMNYQLRKYFDQLAYPRVMSATNLWPDWFRRLHIHHFVYPFTEQDFGVLLYSNLGHRPGIAASYYRTIQAPESIHWWAYDNIHPIPELTFQVAHRTANIFAASTPLSDPILSFLSTPVHDTTQPQLNGCNECPRSCDMRVVV